MGPSQRCTRPKTGRHDERLSERVCVPRRPRTGFERDSRARDACGSGRLKQRIDANRSGEIDRPTLRWTLVNPLV